MTNKKSNSTNPIFSQTYAVGSPIAFYFTAGSGSHTVSITYSNALGSESCCLLLDNLQLSRGSISQKLACVKEGYRFGFNGMEKDDEVKGGGNQYTTLHRIYDPRVGRWLSIDPEMKRFPEKSPFSSFSNNPIIYVDPFGDIDYYNSKGRFIGTDGIKDGKNLMVLKKSTEKLVKAATKQGKTIGLNENVYHDIVNIPGNVVVEAMGIARKKSNAPYGDDKWGGYHEEGFVFGKDKSGKDRIVWGEPGGLAEPGAGQSAIFDPEPAYEIAISEGIVPEGDVHIHPKGEYKGFGFKQGPSELDIDGQPAFESKYGVKSSIVVGARAKNVTFFDSAGKKGSTTEKGLMRANKEIKKRNNK